MPITGGEYQNVIVPPGQDCTISGAKVWGNITALAGSRLFSTSNTVEGNIEADKAKRVDIRAGSVKGDISIVEGPGDDVPSPAGNIADYSIRELATVGGDILFRKNKGFLRAGTVDVKGNITAVENELVSTSTVLTTALNINGSRFGGNIHVAKNRGGAIHVEGNRHVLLLPFSIFGNVQVEENDISGSGQRLRIRFNSTAQNLQVSKNNVAAGSTGMDVNSNDVGANLQVFTTTGGANKSVNLNTVGASIQCKENAAPFVSIGNTAPNKEDQCAA
jgi:hypothetical protein